MPEQAPRRRTPMTVRHVTMEGGRPVVIEETFGEAATKIRHRTRVHGEPTTILREDSTEREEERRSEDPEQLRPERRQLRR